MCVLVTYAICVHMAWTIAMAGTGQHDAANQKH